jgi:hypothetical protein
MGWSNPTGWNSRGWSRAAAGGGGSTITLDPSRLGANTTLSNGNLTATISTLTTYSDAFGTGSGHSTGKYYFEVTLVSFTSGDASAIGIADTNFPSSAYIGTTHSGANASVGLRISSGGVMMGSSSIATVYTLAQSDVMGVAVDLGSKLIWFRKNASNWNNSGTADPATASGGIDISALAAGSYTPALGLEIASTSYTANFGATAYAHSAPSGFGNW